MKTILKAAFLFFSFFGFAQYDVDVIGPDFSSGTTGVWIIKNKMNEKIKGDAYILKDFDHSAIIKIKGGKMYKVRHVNYNAQHGQLVAKFARDSLFVFNPSNIETVEFSDFTLKPFYVPERKQILFYEFLGSSGEKEVLKEYTVRIKEGVFNPMTQRKMGSDSYVMHTNYVIYEDGKLDDIKLKKKVFKNIFEDNFKTIDQFVDEKNLSYKNEEDVKQIFAYQNELL